VLSVVAPNHLQRQFEVLESNHFWVAEITYIRPHEGCLYLAVVLDLFSRQVVGWLMGSRIDTELAMNAQLMAVWRRKLADPVIVHSDQGSQFISKDWRDFLTAHRLEPSMSRRENCHDNAVVESFFQPLNRECIKRKTYPTRDGCRVASNHTGQVLAGEGSYFRVDSRFVSCQVAPLLYQRCLLPTEPSKMMHSGNI
jgi:putative transposase